MRFFKRSTIKKIIEKTRKIKEVDQSFDKELVFIPSKPRFRTLTKKVVSAQRRMYRLRCTYKNLYALYNYAFANIHLFDNEDIIEFNNLSNTIEELTKKYSTVKDKYFKSLDSLIVFHNKNMNEKFLGSYDKRYMKDNIKKINANMRIVNDNVYTIIDAHGEKICFDIDVDKDKDIMYL